MEANIVINKIEQDLGQNLLFKREKNDFAKLHSGVGKSLRNIANANSP